jgi:hypothetical protein
MVFVVYGLMVRTWDGLHLLLLGLTGAVLAGAVAASAVGVPMAVCLLIATAAPVVSVIGFEWVGHRHMAAAVEASRAERVDRPL